MRINIPLGGDRLLAIAFAFMATIALVGLGSGRTAASFTGTTSNPANNVATMLVQAPASQNNATSGPAGVVTLSWASTPTAPGAGHSLTYDVLRGPVGGPYALVGNTASLTYNDTPPADGTYQYVIQAKVTGGGTFTSGTSAAKNGVSDRIAPAMSVTCNSISCAGWFSGTVSVTVSGADGGTGMGSVTWNVDAGSQTSTAGASASFSVTGQASHTVSYFGTDAAGNASSSTNQTVRIDNTPPTAATAIAGAGGQQNGEIQLNWTMGSDAQSGVASQTLRRSAAGTGACPGTSAANYPTTYNPGAAAATYLVTGLVSGSSYCFYIVTSDAAGNSSSSTASGFIAAN
jgi:hypothetical protein